MGYTKASLEKAMADGAVDYASIRTTVAYMLLNQAFALFNNADDELRKYGLSIGSNKMLAGRVYSAFDKYFADSQALFKKGEKETFAADYDRINKLIEDIIKNEIEDAEKHQEYRVCEVCGQRKPASEFSKSYKCRCKECVAAQQRERRHKTKEKDYELETLVLRLDRKKMQARQIYPNTIIVPYDRAKRLIEDIVKYYKSKEK